MRDGILGRFIGARITRVEDKRLLAGAGRYVSDVVVPGMAHAAFVRSPFAHARIRSVDTTEAERLDGVHGVLTGTGMQRRTNPLMGMVTLDGLYDGWHWALATDRVRVVGDPVAIVVAESRAVAEDACELVNVEYEALEPVANVDQALDPRKPVIWPKARSNVLWDSTERHGDVTGAFARADRVIRQRFDQHRHANQPMETRGIVAEIDPVTGRLTIHAAHQSGHLLKWLMAMALNVDPASRSIRRIIQNHRHSRRIAAGVREFLRSKPTFLHDIRPGLPAVAKQAVRDPQRLRYLMRGVLALMAADPETFPRVVIGDIGGAFGSKSTVVREEVAVCAAAIALNRSVKWVEDRNEHLLVGAQAREDSVEVEAAVLDDGRLLGLRACLTMDAGAYPGVPYGAPFFARLIKTMFPGPYDVPALEFRTRIVATNKGTYVAYRGPWAVETWVRERLFDVIARELRVSRADVRLKNMFTPQQLPTNMVTGPALDVRMSARATLEKALELADFHAWEETKAQAGKEGRRLGLGFATYIEPAPGPPGFFNWIVPGFATFLEHEPARATLEADGSITIHTPQVPHGQGHETTLAQVAAGELGVPVELIRVCYGDTRCTPFAIAGTGGSRSAAMAGGAVGVAARQLRREIDRIAADLLEASQHDIVIDTGAVHVAGVPAAAVTLSEVAAEAIRRHGPALDGAALRIDEGWNGGPGGWAQATHLCWVEVNLETGAVRVLRYVVVEDCGDVINPAIVEGQIRGGVAQGIGAVLYEKTAYDDRANPQAGTFMDYLIPTAVEIPDIEIHHVSTPSDVPFNYRGVGEGGMIVAPAAVTNAIEDALADLQVRVTEQHLPPTRILELAGIIPPGH